MRKCLIFFTKAVLFVVGLLLFTIFSVPFPIATWKDHVLCLFGFALMIGVFVRLEHIENIKDSLKTSRRE